MGDPFDPASLAAVTDELTRRGFTEHFVAGPDGLRAVGSGKTFDADEVVIAEHYRFEGVSDPDDMAIVYAIETPTGVRGTLVDAFGVYGDPRVSDFIQDVKDEH